jgi:hypothetical protein
VPTGGCGGSSGLWVDCAARLVWHGRELGAGDGRVFCCSFCGGVATLLCDRRDGGDVLTAAGLLAGPVLGLLDLPVGSEEVQLIAEITLTLVLFAGASRISVRALRREYAVPLRLLGLRLPLTIVAGGRGRVAVLPSVSLIETLAVMLACTDAAFGQAVVTDRRAPSRIRQGLNVERGLNDGLCVPLFLIATAFAKTDEGTESGPSHPWPRHISTPWKRTSCMSILRHPRWEKFARKLAVELWFYPDVLTHLELSTKCTSDQASRSPSRRGLPWRQGHRDRLRPAHQAANRALLLLPRTQYVTPVGAQPSSSLALAAANSSSVRTPCALRSANCCSCPVSPPVSAAGAGGGSV